MNVVKALEHQKAQFQQQARLRESLARLVGSADFEAVITEGYLLHQAADLAREAGNPLSTKDDRKMAMQQAMAPGHLKRYLYEIDLFGEKAQENLELIEEQLIIARAEEMEG